jgi:hypothetical protein
MARLGFLPRRKATQERQMSGRVNPMEELPVIAKTYEVYKKLIELNQKVDKSCRISVSEPAITTCEKLLEELLIAKHAPKAVKEKFLIRANAKAELLSLQIRTILELKLANETNCLKLQAKLSEARRMLGGWLKSVRS